MAQGKFADLSGRVKPEQIQILERRVIENK